MPRADKPKYIAQFTVFVTPFKKSKRPQAQKPSLISIRNESKNKPCPEKYLIIAKTENTAPNIDSKYLLRKRFYPK